MLVKCEHCGHTLTVGGLGRKRLNLPLKNVYKAIRDTSTGAAAGRLLCCSESYVFMILRRQNLKIKDIRDGTSTRARE